MCNHLISCHSAEAATLTAVGAVPAVPAPAVFARMMKVAFDAIALSVRGNASTEERRANAIAQQRARITCALALAKSIGIPKTLDSLDSR